MLTLCIWPFYLSLSAFQLDVVLFTSQGWGEKLMRNHSIELLGPLPNS